MLSKLVTVGVYGYTAETFAAALSHAGADTLCDIRQRRGVRGSEYTFANSQRLQALMESLGIRYVAVKELAPTTEIRRAQAEQDAREGIARRARTELGPAFVDMYQQEILRGYDAQGFLAQLPTDAAVVALLCVERVPEACHRSLAANYLAAALNVPVEHVVP